MDKRGWVILVAASLALATATTVILALRRWPFADNLDDVPDLISDCYERIHDIERDLQQLRPSPQPAT